MAFLFYRKIFFKKLIFFWKFKKISKKNFKFLKTFCCLFSFWTEILTVGCGFWGIFSSLLFITLPKCHNLVSYQIGFAKNCSETPKLPVKKLRFCDFSKKNYVLVNTQLMVLGIFGKITLKCWNHKLQWLIPKYDMYSRHLAKTYLWNTNL